MHDVKKIPLTQGKFTIVDDADFEKVNQYKWFYQYGYAKRSRYLGGKGKNRRYYSIPMQRFILDMDNLVDHINGDTLDNRKCNLRIVTKTQNNQNHGIRKDNSVGITGVSYFKHCDRYMAYIGVNRKLINLGYFIKLPDAVKARKEAENLYYGEFKRRAVISYS